MDQTSFFFPAFKKGPSILIHSLFFKKWFFFIFFSHISYKSVGSIASIGSKLVLREDAKHISRLTRDVQASIALELNSTGTVIKRIYDLFETKVEFNEAQFFLIFRENKCTFAGLPGFFRCSYIYINVYTYVCRHVDTHICILRHR